MYDLAGKSKNAIHIDLTGYIIKNDICQNSSS